MGYSAGLLRHFFRVKLKINLPPEQVYAVEDFGRFEARLGFTKFKVMVQNATEPIVILRWDGGWSSIAHGGTRCVRSFAVKTDTAVRFKIPAWRKTFPDLA